ncbi:MAG: hypothetical protein BWZ05_01755 [Bacteroidetes bacterium ADurb.BinA245]|nr:MAG: hypothetical protein BWZ05_01755 [Bacteroidetes bacterium ADurb.BinA245]
MIVEPTCRLVLRFTWSFLYVLKLIPPTQALTSPVTGSIAIKADCSICNKYFMESRGVITVSLSRFAFHEKIFIGTFTSKLALISFSVMPSSSIFFQRSDSLIDFSIRFSCPFQIEPVFISDRALMPFCNIDICCAIASSAYCCIMGLMVVYTFKPSS